MLIRYALFHKLMRIGKLFIENAKEHENNAKLSGNEYSQNYWSDRIREGEAYVAGLNGKVPEGWEDFENLVELEIDPEYAEYQRLRKKFG